MFLLHCLKVAAVHKANFSHSYFHENFLYPPERYSRDPRPQIRIPRVWTGYHRMCPVWRTETTSSPQVTRQEQQVGDTQAPLWDRNIGTAVGPVKLLRCGTVLFYLRNMYGRNKRWNIESGNVCACKETACFWNSFIFCDGYWDSALNSDERRDSTDGWLAR